MRIRKRTPLASKYGRITVIRELPATREGKDGKSIYRWVEGLCDCGKQMAFRLSSLRSGTTKSCGCWHRERLAKINTKHGHAKRGQQSRLFKLWSGMWGRCASPSGAYRKRGITVCPEWKDFAVFASDMGEPPTAKHSIDRINNSLGYSKENCRWATSVQQMRNTRRNRMVLYHGSLVCLTEVANDCGLTTQSLLYRMKKGLTVDQAADAPKKSWIGLVKLPTSCLNGHPKSGPGRCRICLLAKKARKRARDRQRRAHEESHHRQPSAN